MPETASPPQSTATPTTRKTGCRVAVLWIDWYAYHVARFRGILAAPGLAQSVEGIEMVGGIGVHAGLKFREDLPPDVRVHTLMPESGWLDAGQLRLAYRLWHQLTHVRPEVLLIPGYYTLPAIAAAIWAKLHRCTSVLMAESTADDHVRVASRELAKSILVRTLFDWAVTGGAAHRNYLRRLGFPSDRIARYYDVVDNDFYNNAAQRLRKFSARSSEMPLNYFLYIGRFAPEKNVHTLLAKWLEYRRAGGTWSLVLVGDGPDGEALRKVGATSEFAADICFAGLRKSSELPRYYAFASCFVLPSSREPWGLVVNEAMASSLPVIVSNRCGCAEDLVDQGVNGYIFDESNPAELAYYLHRVEAMGSSANQQMGLHSRRKINEFSPESFGKEIKRIYDLRYGN